MNKKMKQQEIRLAELQPYLFPDESVVLEAILETTYKHHETRIKLIYLAGLGINFKKIETALKSLQKFNIILIEPNITTPDRFFIIFNKDKSTYNDKDLHTRRNRRWGLIENAKIKSLGGK